MIKPEGRRIQVESRSASVRAFFDETDRYLARNPHIPVRAHIVRELLGDVRGARVLDVGCGDGSVSLPLLAGNNRLTLLDLSENMLARARERAPAESRSRVQYVHSNLVDFEADEPYDICLCIGVLAHVDSVEGAIAKVARLLRPGGRAVFEISDCDKLVSRLQILWSKIRAHGYTLNRTTVPSVRAAAERSGLRFLAMRRLSPTLFMMGRLPFNWLVSYEMFAVRHSLLACLCAGAMLTFESRPSGSPDR